MVRVFLLLLALLAQPGAVSAAESSSLVAAAEKLGLADSAGWQALLLMRERAFGPATSLIASPGFFLAAKASWTPRAELEATLAAMLSPPGPNPDEHPSCRFPARRQWLATNLPEFSRLAPTVRCPELLDWRDKLRADGISFVFSSYFANNPSSMFGHSFLRFHKRPLPGKVASPMLDEALNFTAFPTTDDPFLYAVYGLAGRFPGRFTMTPLYLKIQEYNNAESRDLWDYQLNFTAEELALLELVVWEVSPQWINYWYFDENCSLVLLEVLKAAKPTLSLDRLHPWVIPSDSLRVLTGQPGLVKEVTFRPSALSRFLASYRALSTGEQSVVTAMVEANDPDEAMLALHLLPHPAQARVSDVVVDYIDYDEKLAGSKVAEVYYRLRTALLLRRAKQTEPRPMVEVPLPQGETPHLPSGTTRIGAGAGYSPQAGSLLQAEWRPALHDWAEPSLGNSPGLAITFFDTVVRYASDQRKAYLQSWDPLTVRSIPHTESITHPFAWDFATGVENLGYCPRLEQSCYVERVRGGVGPVLALGPATLFSLAEVELGASGEPGLSVYYGPRLTAGLKVALSPREQLALEVCAARAFGPDRTARDENCGEGSAAVMLGDSYEVRLAAKRRIKQGAAALSEAMLSIYRFY